MACGRSSVQISSVLLPFPLRACASSTSERLIYSIAMVDGKPCCRRSNVQHIQKRTGRWMVAAASPSVCPWRPLALVQPRVFPSQTAGIWAMLRLEQAKRTKTPKKDPEHFPRRGGLNTLNTSRKKTQIPENAKVPEKFSKNPPKVFYHDFFMMAPLL